MAPNGEAREQANIGYHLNTCIELHGQVGMTHLRFGAKISERKCLDNLPVLTYSIVSSNASAVQAYRDAGHYQITGERSRC